MESVANWLKSMQKFACLDLIGDMIKDENLEFC